jgi:hypothetical protein
VSFVAKSLSDGRNLSNGRNLSKIRMETQTLLK